LQTTGAIPAAIRAAAAPPRSDRAWLPPLAAALLLGALLGAGWLFAEAMGRYGENQEAAHLRTVAMTAAVSLDPQLVAQLHGRLEDAGTPAFEALRASLKRIRARNPASRFVYLMQQRGADIVFLLDAEPPDSPDYSAPGSIYSEAPPGIRRVFASGEARVEGPYQDRWGQWVTGLAPVAGAEGGAAQAVLGIDINAHSWMARVARYREFALTIAGLVTAIAVLTLSGLALQRRFNQRLAQLNTELKTELAERRRAEEGLRLAAAVIENTAEGVMVIDAQERVESVNPAFERITGYSGAEAVGQKASLLASGRHDADFFQVMRADLDATGKWHGEIWNRRRNGEIYPQETTINTLRDGSGRVVHYAAVFSDISMQKQLEQQLRELSAIDGLTGIANRRRFDETLQREWLRLRRDQGPLSLIMLDLDHFKKFNDRYGHLAGDRCLQQVAGVLREASRRPGDLAARYGGEEFAVILPATDEPGARQLAERIRSGVAGLAVEHALADAGVVTVSLGVATLVPQQSANPATLIDCADRALYQAKERGRNQVAVAVESPRAC